MELSPDLAYWLGVAQTDGSYFTGLVNKKRIRPTMGHHENLQVSEKSREMIEKFVHISSKLFESKATIRNIVKKVNGKEFQALSYNLGIASKIEEINSLGLNLKEIVPPSLVSPTQIGAYLAAVIDGDGSVKLKYKNGVTPEFYIKIFSNNEPIELASFIEDKFKIKTHCRKIRNSDCYELEFMVTYTNQDFFTSFIIPEMAITKKRQKIEQYIKMRRYDEFYNILRKVPEGMVTTYKEIANAAGITPRHAGYLLHVNPTDAPCHRVVLSTSKLGGYASGPKEKQEILEKEGVQIINGKISHFDKVLYKF